MPAEQGLPGPDLAGLIGRKDRRPCQPSIASPVLLQGARRRPALGRPRASISFLADPAGCFRACGCRCAASRDAAERQALVRFLGHPRLALTVDGRVRLRPCRAPPQRTTMMARKTLQLGRAVEWPQDARRGKTRPRAQSAEGHQLRGALRRAGIHLALPGHRTTGFRASGDRLCARPVAAGVEIAKALCRRVFATTARFTRIARS